MTTQRSLELFHKAARELPAYKEFLAAKGLHASAIRTPNDLSQVPITSKKSYLVPARREDLIWENDLNGLMWFCSTSGSTGEPYYFPRNAAACEQASIMMEEFLRNSSYGEGRTLVLITFGMGVWIGGIITLQAFELAAKRMNHPVSILPVGYNKTEIFKALKKLSPDFDQTIIVGYPPFVKELVDQAPEQGINFKALKTRVMFAAEAFTETFRDYICEKTGIEHPLLDTLNTYGTADIGAMAYETPLSILVRSLALKDPLLFKDIFGQIEKTPTLAQYNPDYLQFEVVDGEIIITADGALPLIRYAIGDHGGVLEYDQLESLFKRNGVDLGHEIEKAGIKNTVSRNPFVYVYERTDFSTTLHGIIIYPEFIKEGLLDPSVASICTERFTMLTKTDVHHNQYLQVHVELQQDVEESDDLTQKVHDAIAGSLIEKSSEFSEVSRSRASEGLIQVKLWPYGYPRYFAPNSKQKWVEKA